MKKAVIIVAFVVVVVGALSAVYLFSRDLQGQMQRIYQEGGVSVVYGELRDEHGKKIRMNDSILLCGVACFPGRSTVKGEFAFTHIPQGEYFLYVVHKGCRSDEREVTVGANDFVALSRPLTTQC